MKLYDEHDPAPNPRRVRIFLAEKGIDDIEMVRVALARREHKSAAHLARNSLGQLPVLELDDGRLLSESVSICRYLEALHPAPPLFGRDDFERASVDMWIRRIELTLMSPVSQFWRHAHWLTAPLLTQHKAFGESNRERTDTALRWLEGELADGRGYIAGEAFTMADIVCVTTTDFADLIGLPIPPDCSRLTAWRASMGERASVAMDERVALRFRRPEVAAAGA